MKIFIDRRRFLLMSVATTSLMAVHATAVGAGQPTNTKRHLLCGKMTQVDLRKYYHPGGD